MTDSEQRSDASLLRAWQEGDAAAGTRLLRRHFETLKAFFEAHHADDPGELVSATFEACLTSGSDLPDDGSFREHLLRFARRQLKKGAT